MKLRAIRLTNVRKFSGVSAEIADIADGVTVVTAPNEAGKSTFLAALSAFVFSDHKSRAAEIRGLRPHSGGAVEIEIAFETEDGARWRAWKRFLSRPEAGVVDAETGRLVARDDEAEAWLARRMGIEGRAPAGLLWVRQGDVDLEPAGSGGREKSARESLRGARQDLMSAIGGQIDAVTGGARMDRIMRDCEARLSEILTPTGLPRTGGPLAGALARLSEARGLRDRLAAQVAETSRAVEARARLRAKLAAALDTEATRKLDCEITDARARLAGAQSARALRDAADTEIANAREARAARREAAERRRDLGASLAQAQEALDKAQARHGKARAALEDARAACEAQETTLETASGERRALEARLSRARRREAARHEADRLQAMRDTLTRAEAALGEVSAAQARLETDLPDDAALDAVEAAAERYRAARIDREASAPVIEARYNADTRIGLADGVLDPDAPMPVLSETILELPGIGNLTIRPAAGEEGDVDARCLRDLEEALAGAGIGDVEAARAARAARAEAQARKMQAEATVAALAPSGLAALRAQVEALAAEIGAAEDLGEDEAHAVLETACTEARDAEDAARDVLSGRHAARESARAEMAGAEAELAAAGQACDTLRAQRDAGPGIAETEAAVARAEARVSEALAARDNLGHDDIDLAGYAAEVGDLERARAAAEEVVSGLRTEIAQIEGTIRARAEDDVEARLSEIGSEIEALEAEIAEHRHRAAVLTHLRDTLAEARRAARDAYFQPVRDELAPLLAHVHGISGIEIDDAAILPAQVTRDGVTESVESLSDGAREQIAILTRLAFARLAVRSGGHVPVILDDALVYADDVRIARMFEALSSLGPAQQILVLSCRSAAMGELDGARREIVTLPDTPAA